MKRLLLLLSTAAIALTLMAPAAQAKAHHKKHHQKHHQKHHRHHKTSTQPTTPR